jgi:hypothetical protein
MGVPRASVAPTGYRSLNALTTLQVGAAHALIERIHGRAGEQITAGAVH